MTEPLALGGDERILVTGASGWLGRSLLSTLLPVLPAQQLMAVGSRARNIVVDGTDVEISAWDVGSVERFRPTHIAHLAYLTRDRLDNIGWQSYVAQNVALTARIVDLLALPTIRALIHTSSGAASRIYGPDAAPASVQPYGLLKRIDELLFANECETRRIACVTCRVWSVTGPHVVEPRKYAFSDLILQAMSGGDLCVRSPHRVYRRYVDASELMDVAMRLGLASRSVAFDSGGTYVELEDLADLILTEIGQPGMRVRRESPPDGLMDDYSADDSVFRDLAASMGVHITDLQGQIVGTARALRPGFHKMDPRTDPS